MKIRYSPAVLDEIERLNGNRRPVLYPNPEHGPLLLPAWQAELARRIERLPDASITLEGLRVDE